MFERAKPIEHARYDSKTNAITKWVATNDHPINIVKDNGLQADCIYMYVALTVDYCTSVANGSYLSVTGHVVN